MTEFIAGLAVATGISPPDLLATPAEILDEMAALLLARAERAESEELASGLQARLQRFRGR